MQLQKLCQMVTRKYIFVVGFVGITYLILQSFMLPYSKALKPLLPENEIVLNAKSGFLLSQLVKSENEGDVYTVNHRGAVEKEKQTDWGDNGTVLRSMNVPEIVSLEVEGEDDHVGIVENGKHGSEIEVVGSGFVNQLRENKTMLESVSVENMEQFVGLENQSLSKSRLESNVSLNSDGKEDIEDQTQGNLVLPGNIEEFPRSDFDILRNDSMVMGSRRRKKAKSGMPPVSVVSIDQMNRRLARHFALSTKMKSKQLAHRDPDKEILDAKLKIINPTVSNVDDELYAPVFRNISLFIRSYELMEQTLKVYIYKDGKKPIFHQPILKGLYASEGWFMKLMKGNKHFVAKNPEKAHLFYMPFSSRMLQYTLFDPEGLNKTILRQFVKNYTEKIAAKYPFWNRTGGKDHFLVACHDWAPYETRHHMENSIKALCNADVTTGFKIGRDVSLPETFIRDPRNPLRDIGGKPPSKRNIFAFYAGNSHGYLRPILLKHWKDKDPEMRIYGLLPKHVSKKMNYIQHMKSSKYCICPKGFEVNSPRIVEAIYYECVPVIISDNFVPPFFEVLNWEHFSVILPEKDIPNLKEILLSIPEEKYIDMQLAVQKVQKHFLWHARPVKYDLFHMTLLSIWHSRVFQR